VTETLIAEGSYDIADVATRTESDVGWLTFLTRLRSTGMPIRLVRDYVELCWAGDGKEDARLALLVAHREAVRNRLAQA
jgi:DNA-binding transcriptional MerR regulator